MRAIPLLGPTNLALVSIYFVPVWGRDALRTLTSPYNGFEDGAQAAAAIYIRQIFDFGLDGLLRTSSVLAGIKLVIAAAFAAYLIEFVRALLKKREPNRETADVVLLLALATLVIWALPILTLGDAGLIRLQATQFLLLVGASVVITVERYCAPAEMELNRSVTVARERDEAQRAAAAETLVPLGTHGAVAG